mmetsp:Transcript_48873/g.141580  ORF Transcript_48873/g.141580 Transcript_48873/m.141580 type:complete len:378 (-) Transcript_48873:101-1234(-)
MRRTPGLVRTLAARHALSSMRRMSTRQGHGALALSNNALVAQWGARRSANPSMEYLCSLSLDDHRGHELATLVRDQLQMGFARLALDFASFSRAISTQSRFDDIAKQYVEFVNYLEECPADTDRGGFAELMRYMYGLQRHSMQSVANGVRDLMAELGSGYRAVQPQVDAMWQAFARMRIKTELLMAHYLASLKHKEGFAGSFRLENSPLAVAQKIAEECAALCEARMGVAPQILVREENEGALTYVPMHLEYVLREIFKNACRAVVESHMIDSESALPPIACTIAYREDTVLLRVVDQGGGMTPEQIQNAWKFMHSTVSKSAWSCEPNGVVLAGYGIGLPLSRLLAQQFGGDLHVESQEGTGTQVDIILRRASPYVE